VVVLLLVGLFAFGTLASGLSAASLLDPGGVLEPIWRLNPRARENFGTLGALAPVLMVVVCAACTTTAAGLVLRRAWGYWAAVVMLSLNAAGDLISTIVGTEPRAVIGIPIVLVLLWRLSRPRAREYLHSGSGAAP